MIIGTAGHIDHGKTTLLKALTGVDCDRLKEEKDRGITVDLGYAYSPISDAADTADSAGAPNRMLGFIDVPGHEKLVHNMLAGATGIDFALLVIAADDGPMPQTREHLEIIDLLGIRRGAVALSKIDMVSGERLAEAENEIRALLADSGLRTAPIFPLDALSGHGVMPLRAHLEAVARETGERACKGRFRLAVDRVFTLTGIGTVVTGTALSGRVNTGDQLTLSPSGKSVRVRSLRVQDTPAESGQAGQRIALALSGIEKSDIRRGMCVLAPELHRPQNRFAVTLNVLSSQPLLKHWTPIHCHLGAEDIPGRLALLEGDELAPGASGLAEIILERELSVIAGDHFILRDASARHTLGGGRVLDIFPPARKKRSAERLSLLHALAGNDPSSALGLAAEQQAAGVDLGRYAINHNLETSEVAQLCQAHAIKRVADSGFSASHWQQLGERVLAVLGEEHTRHADMPGVERDRLRRLTLPTLPRAAFDTLTAELLAAGRIARSGAWLHLPEHRIQLAAHDQSLWLLLKPLLDKTPYGPPRVRDVAHATGIAEDTVRNIMKNVARVGLAYPVAHDHYFTATAVDELAQHVAALCASEGVARAARLRDAIGGGRKVAVHILEFFDRIGYTRRVRDNHVLRQATGTQQFS
jgi:selenocysteine-specific elongation factor